MSNYALGHDLHFDVPTRQGRPENIFPDKQIICALGVSSKPTYLTEEISNQAIQEAKILYDNGIRNIMIQNVKDVPMLDCSRIETIASMTSICLNIRKAIPSDCLMGLSLLRENGKALVAIAQAASLDYIRPKCYVGAVINHDGIHEGIVNDVLQAKIELQSNVEIMPDIFERTSSALGNFTLIEAVGQATSFGLAKCINLAGRNFEESIQMAKEVRKAFPNLKIYLGGGANLNNLEEVLKYFDGVHVASCLKDSGNMTGKYDENKIKAFMAKYQDLL